MKRISICLLLVTLFTVNTATVKATEKEFYYTTKSGIELTEKEYNYIVTMFDEHYLDFMNEQDYDVIKKMNVNTNDIEYKIYEPSYIDSRSTTIETNSKKLAISKSCTGTVCSMTLTNVWKGVPKVKSYDVLGARIGGTTFSADSFVTVFKFDSGTKVCTEYVKASNGFGCSYKLETGSTTYYSAASFDVNTSGLVTGSYQHASKSVTLSVSKNYTFSVNGEGNVFLFNTTKGQDAYDGMSGVSIKV